MERQLKERLVGAAVLVAVAIILIPEMLSGPKLSDSEPGSGNVLPAASQPKPTDTTSAPAATDADEPTSAVKTFTIDLNKSDATKVEQDVQQSAATQTKVPPPEEAPIAATMTNEPIAQKAEQLVEQKVEQKVARPSVAPEAKAATTQAPQESDTKPKPQSNADNARPARAANGWAVQVASLGARDAADRLAAQLKQQGHPAFVMAFQVKDKTLFRVRVGPAAERRAADELLAKIKREYPAAAVVPHP